MTGDAVELQILLGMAGSCALEQNILVSCDSPSCLARGNGTLMIIKVLLPLA
jgi:hypothetical protein